MKRTLLVGMLALLTACAQSPEQKAIESRAAERMINLIDAEGPALLCTQKSWLLCTARSEQQCLQEVAALRPDCRAEGRLMAGQTPTFDSGKQFSQVYVTCLGERHVASLVTRTRDEVNACLQDNPLNSQQVTERLKRLSQPIIDDARKEAQAARKKKSANP